MGIQGLLPLLKDIQRKTSVSVFHGNSVGIDAYCWLHKGVYGCAKEVVEGKKTNLYINYIIRRINMLLSYNVTPILVFDGGYLPAKASKEKERRQAREENLKKGKAFLRAGNTTQATECFQRCVEITPAMATEVIQACRERNVMCIVAPYEADAQLAYLEMQGITQFTITEDSDLLIYGCKKVLFKMSSDGDGTLIDLDELNKVKTVALESFTMEKFRHMCILSGCDYLPSVKGLGLYKAHKYLKRSTNVYKAIQLIKQERKLTVPPDYAESFRRTDAVFKYQLVFDPRIKKVVRLNEVLKTDNVTEDELRFAGPPMDAEKAIRIALGNIDPITGQPLASFENFIHPTSGKKQAVSSTPMFVDTKVKIRNPEIRYSLGEETEAENKDEDMLEELYLERKVEKLESERQVESTKDGILEDKEETSPPEKSLRNIHLYEKQNPPIASSIGILYGENKLKDSSSVTLGHHSVFVKRAKHKFKNPFRCDDEEMSESAVMSKSKYFNASKEDKENDDMASTQSPAEDLQQCTGDETISGAVEEGDIFAEELKPSPPSKRSKISFIQYLDSQSKNSLKHAAATMTDNESSLNFSDINKSPCNPEIRKFPLKTKNMSSEREPLLPIWPEISESKRKDSGTLSLTRFMVSTKSSAVNKDETNDVPSRISLFRNCNETVTKPHRTFEGLETYSQSNRDSGIPLIQTMANDNEMSSELSQDVHSQKEYRSASLLHLHSRSHSDSSLSRSSFSKAPVIGKCKKIGLSKRTRSSLDRVRDNQSKLTQTKLGFEKFAYSKKKIDWNEQQKEDVICTS